MKPQLSQCQTCEERERSIFCGLPATGLAEIEAGKTLHAYKPHQVIFYQGNQPYGVYCIASGKVKVYKMDAGGHQQIVRLAGPGDLLGYRCILSGEPYTATAETIEDATICFIDKKTFLHTLEMHPKTAFNVMTLLADDLRHAETQMTHFIHKNVRERLAEVFLLLNTRYGQKTKNGSKLNISLTREEVATLIGTTQESVIRLMTEFKHNGLIEVDGRQVTILNLSALTDTANLAD